MYIINVSRNDNTVASRKLLVMIASQERPTTLSRKFAYSTASFVYHYHPHSDDTSMRTIEIMVIASTRLRELVASTFAQEPDISHAFMAR